jgi:nitroreductase
MNGMFQRLRYTAFKLKELFQLLMAAGDDARRYARYSFTGFARNHKWRGLIQGRLMAQCHVIEKGLSMPGCRPRFGREGIHSLHALLLQYEANGGQCCEPHFRSGLEALDGYLKFHQKLGVDVADIITAAILKDMDRWKQNCQTGTLGVLHYTRETFFADADASFPHFHESRHSCRHFDPLLPVNKSRIAEAVRIALRAPSGCNRQPWRVYCVSDQPLREQCLDLHSGSRGFSHLIPLLLIVTARMDVYSGPGERNQTYVDGGLFAMSLMLALHHQRLGCVPLNWSVSPRRDRQLKAITAIPASENILMLLGVGHPVGQFTVPQSARRHVEEVLVFLDKQ